MEASELFEFSDLPRALAAAEASGRWVIVDFTAEWCGPCRAMERTAWVDEGVRRWMGEHAHGVRIDIDRHEEIAKRFSVRAVPTVIALRKGEEVDRFTGARSAKEVLEWAEGLLAGRTEHARLEAQATGTDVHARFEFARNQLLAGRPAEALPHFAWLWTHALEHAPDWAGVRYSFLLGMLEELVEALPSARAEFTRLRDVAEAGAQAPTGRDRQDWLALNGVLDEVDRSLAWFDTVKDALSAEQAGRLERWLSEPLISRDRWSDLARLYPNPLAALERQQQLLAEMLEPEAPEGMDPALVEEMRAGLREYGTTALRKTAADLTRACLAAGRREEAARLVERAKAIDPSTEMITALEEARAGEKL